MYIRNKRLNKNGLSHNKGVRERRKREYSRLNYNKESTISKEDRINRRDEKKIYVLFYKPKGIITTLSPYEGPNILDFVRLKQSLGYAGRLDKDAEGLILLTNDGALINKITHPRFKTEKVYDVKLNKPFNDFDKLRRIIIEKMRIRVRVKPINKPKTRLRVIIAEGRKHIVKIIFKKLGYHVTGLKRSRIGGLSLGNLRPGEYKIIPRAQAYKTII